MGHRVLIALCAVLVTLPLWLHGPSCGHDFDFHLQSWIAARAALAAHPGALPHWLPSANYGAGEPRFVFYPPLSWLFGAALGAFLSALHLVALPWSLVPQTLTTLALTSAGLAFYQLAARNVRSPLAAFGACLYLANPYLLFVAYERTAYGELLAATAVPLLLLYAPRARPPLVPLTLVVAALWLLNAPSAVMGCYLVAFCGVAAALHARSWRPAARSASALALGTALAAAYVLPAWYQQRWVEISRVIGPGMRIEDSFLFGHTGEPFHDQVLHTASLIAAAMLAIGLVASLTAAYLASRPSAASMAGDAPLPQMNPRATPPPEANDLARQPRVLPATLATLLATILLLQLPASLPLWHHAPELAFLQFPWRWLLVAGPAAALALTLALARLEARRPASRRSSLLPLAAACAIAILAGQLAARSFAQPCDDEDNVRAQLTLPGPSGDASADTIPGFEGTDEYTPRNADNSEIQQGLPRVRILPTPDADEGDDTAAPNPAWQQPQPSPGVHTGQIQIDRWAPEDKQLTLTSSAPAYAVLRLMDYPAWRVELQGTPIPRRPHREDGLLTIPVPAGTTHIIIHWQQTPDVRVGRALSAAALLLLVLLVILAIRRRGAALRYDVRDATGRTRSPIERPRSSG